MNKSKFWLKVGSLCPTVTLIIKLRSPNCNQPSIKVLGYIQENFEITPTVQEIWCTKSSFDLNLAVCVQQ